MPRLVLAALLFLHVAAQAQQSLGIIKHNHLALQVKDLEASKKFYGETLGLQPLAVPDNLKAIRGWFKIGPDQQIHLMAGRTADVTNDRNGSHIAVFVESIDKSEAFLKARNITYHAQTRFDGVKQIYFPDPDGYLIELNEWKAPKPGQ
ncbi:MAG: VOC family protein [Sphingobacteriaceae bacterium]|nr:VOC family protein [Cytophagaceae bacterium]